MSKWQELSTIEQEAFLQAGKSSLIDFTILTNPQYDPNWHHEEIARKLEAVERGEIKRLIINLPPRHGKSELASIRFPAWYIGRNPQAQVITASYSAELATDFGSKTRDVVGHELYQKIFNTKLRSDDKSKGKWRTGDDGYYLSVGVGGPITGRGANIFIIDDPLKNREEADSEVIREKVWNWFTSTAFTRLEPNAAIIIMVTRWHTDDLVGRLVEQQEKSGDKYEIINYPAIAEQDEKHRKKGEALWENRFPLSELKQKQNVIGPYDWESLYQQNPIPSEKAEFKREFFRYFEEKEIENKDLQVFVAVDLAISKGETANNSSIQVVGKNRNEPEWYLLEENTGRLDPGQVIEYLFHLKNKYQHKLSRVGIETVAYQKSLLYFLTEEMKKRQSYFDIVELKAKGEKETRIRGLIPLYKAGIIYHNTHCNEFEHELLTFPVGKLDDRIDALAYIPQVIENTDYSRGLQQARSPITKTYLNRRR